MTLIEWQEQFRIGIPAVDYEHREMIDLLNELYAGLKARADHDQVEAFLGEIHARISAHFALEERVMKERGYDQYAEHKTQHEELLDQIREIMESYDRDELDRSLEALGKRLESWFGDHFRTHDARLHKTIGDIHPGVAET